MINAEEMLKSNSMLEKVKVVRTSMASEVIIIGCAMIIPN